MSGGREKSPKQVPHWSATVIVGILELASLDFQDDLHLETGDSGMDDSILLNSEIALCLQYVLFSPISRRLIAK